MAVNVQNLFTTRNFVGALLFMVLVGEFQLGGVDKTLTPFGIVLYVMYFAIFLMVDSIVTRYKLLNYQIFLLNFALYGILVTGFIHAEIANYILQPQNDLITTLIRLQSSTYMFYAYVLVNRFLPMNPNRRPLSVKYSVTIFVLYVLILTPSGSYGLFAIAKVFEVAPLYALVFGILAAVALYAGLKDVKPGQTYRNSKTIYMSAIFVAIAVIPSVFLIVPYYLLMVAVTAVLLSKKRFRNSPMPR